MARLLLQPGMTSSLLLLRTVQRGAAKRARSAASSLSLQPDDFDDGKEEKNDMDESEEVDEGHAADELDFDWNVDELVGHDHGDDQQQLFDVDSSSDDDASSEETKEKKMTTRRTRRKEEVKARRRAEAAARCRTTTSCSGSPVSRSTPAITARKASRRCGCASSQSDRSACTRSATSAVASG